MQTFFTGFRWSALQARGVHWYFVPALVFMFTCSCVFGAKENAYRSTLSQEKAESRRRQNEAQARSREVALWESRVKQTPVQPCVFSIADIDAIRHDTFSVAPLEDHRGRVAQLPAIELEFDEEIGRLHGCIVAYTIRAVKPNLSLPGVHVELSPAWNGPWQVGKEPAPPLTVFRGKVIGFHPLSLRLGVNFHDENLAIGVAAITRLANGQTNAQLELSNIGLQTIHVGNLRAHIHHADGQLNAPVGVTLSPQQSITELVELFDVANAALGNELIRVFGYGESVPSQALEVGISAEYRVAGRSTHFAMQTRTWVSAEIHP